MAFKLLSQHIRLEWQKIGTNQNIFNNLCFTNKQQQLIKRSLTKKALIKGPEEGSTKFKSYILSRYIEYLRRYEKVLEKKFPAAMRVYRVFMVGTKEFYRDVKEYINIRKRVNLNDGLKSLTRHEIELYYKMPKDMIRVAPVLILSAIPFTNYVIFPLAYFFPRVLLTSHFWSLQQRSDFAVTNLSKRLIHYKPTFRCLQEHLRDITSPDLHLKWSEVVGLLGSGQQPTTEQILACEELFAGDNVYNLRQLTYYHVRELIKMHGLHGGFFRRNRLRDHAMIIHEMDLAVMREGGATCMTLDTLKSACFLRGINGATMTQSSMINWLEKWLTVSKNVNEDNASLLLHCPILLAYNEPSNWMIIYNKKYKDKHVI